MAKVTARNTAIRILDSNGASRLISGRSNSAEMSFTAEAVDVTTFGAGYREYVADGLRDWELSIDGMWDGAASQIDEILYGVLGACTSLCYGPSGSTTGMVQYSGCAICTEYTVSGAVEGAVTFSATFKAASQLNRGTW